MLLLKKKIRNIYGRILFYKNKRQYISLNEGDDFRIKKEYIFPIYNECFEKAGTVDEHYFLQDIYFARKIIHENPHMHYDIGSRIDGFIGHLLGGGIEVTLLDIRPFDIQVDGLAFIKTDATELKEIADNSLTSLSSLHAIEHFGLGRYGDIVDPYAWVKALKSVQEKIAVGGYFYLGLPVGKEDRVCFNAHRIFKPGTIVEQLNKMQLCSYAYIHDYKIIKADINDEVEGDFDCGLFVFKKKDDIFGNVR